MHKNALFLFKNSKIVQRWGLPHWPPAAGGDLPPLLRNPGYTSGAGYQ